MDSIRDKIKECVRLILPQSKVYLFGSRARGDFQWDSDYDILVVIPEKIEVKEKFPLKTAIRKLLVKSGIASDILIEGEEELNIKKSIKGHIVRTALNESVEL